MDAEVKRPWMGSQRPLEEHTPVAATDHSHPLKEPQKQTTATFK